jgi:predicted RNA binding protein YcfA (HicA-like mRNA interferase family)
MNSRDAIKQLEAVGFEIKRRGRGSHLILERGDSRIVVSHPSQLSQFMAGKVRAAIHHARKAKAK